MSFDASFLAWIALALVVSLSPGPDVMLVLGHAARGGRRRGMLAVAGIITGGLWYMALCGFGFLTVLTTSTTIFAIVKFCGTLYLAYLGVRLICGAVDPRPQPTDTPLLSLPFRQGLVSNVFNPKIALFYLAVLPQFTGRGPNAPLLGVLFIAIHYAIGAVWLSILAFGAARASSVAQQSSVWRWIEGALGGVFLGFAGRLAAERN